MSETKQIWLAPICHEDGDGRQWCQDDVWGDDCGCGIAEHQSVRYVLAADYDRLEQECERLRVRISNLEIVQSASIGVSGMIKSAASELGFDPAVDESALDYLIERARKADQVGDLIRSIQAAINTTIVPASISRIRAEYYKAGAAHIVRNVDEAISALQAKP